MTTSTFKFRGFKCQTDESGAEALVTLIKEEQRSFWALVVKTTAAAVMMITAATMVGSNMVAYKEVEQLPRDFGIELPTTLTIDTGFGTQVATAAKSQDAYPGGFSGLPLLALDKQNYVEEGKLFYVSFGKEATHTERTKGRVTYVADGDGEGYFSPNKHIAPDPVQTYHFDTPLSPATINVVGADAKLVSRIAAVEADAQAIEVTFDLVAMQAAGHTTLLPLDEYFQSENNRQRSLWESAALAFSILVVGGSILTLWGAVNRGRARLKQAGATSLLAQYQFYL